MTITSDKKTPDGRRMVAIPIKIEFVAYTEEHAFLEQMTLVGGDIEVIKGLHTNAIVDLCRIDDRLIEIQEGWSQILVERVK